MNTRIFLIAGFLFLCNGCSKEGITSPYQDNRAIPQDEYTVLSVLVDSTFGLDSSAIIVVDDSTSPGLGNVSTDSSMNVYLEYIQQHIAGIMPDAIADFKFKNSARTFVDAPARIHPRCVRRSDTTLKFPNIQVSRVGYSTDRTQALAYLGTVWAPLGGYGEFYVLSNAGGTWKVAGSVMTWIS